ncbi:MAG TPA: FAD-dependent oxidoreductase, partial [Thermodesulfobacteriota bacterium]
MRVAVVGAGGVGSAAARHLAKAGHEVLLVEQFEVDHDRGSSYGDSRVTRLTYHEPIYTAMMVEAYRLWEALQAEADELLQTRCGILVFGKPTHPEILGTIRSLEANGVPYERLDAAEVA